MLTVDLAGVERQGLLAATAHFHLGIVSVNTIPKLVAEVSISGLGLGLV